MSKRNEGRAGYKKTKVGWIPEDWKVCKISEFAKVTSGGTPARQKEAYWNGNIPWVTTSLIDFGVITKTNEYITEAGLRNSSAKIFPTNTILMAMYGQGQTRGKVSILGIGATTNQACAAILVIKPVHKAFIFFFLYFSYEKIRKIGNASTQKNLNADLIKQILIPLPPLPEQEKIAAILSAWDRAIEQTRQLIDAKRRLKKGLMQQLLTGRKRFEGFGKPAANGELPEGWRRIELSNVFSRIQHIAPKNIKTVLSITSTVGFVDQRKKFNKVIAGKNLERYVYLKKGDFSYNKGNSKSYPQGCIYKLEEFEEGVVPNVYYSFRADSDDIYPEFYKYYFEHGSLNRQLHRIINTGVRNDGLLNINAQDFFHVEILLPPMGEQKKITDLLSAVNFKIQLLEQKEAALRRQKRGMMQKLLTGEVRVGTGAIQ